MRKRYLWIAVGVVGIGVLVVLWPQNVTPMAQRLPDGSFVRIMSLEYGTGHQYKFPPLKAWQRFLAERLPLSWTVRFGWREDGGSFSYAGPPGETILGVVTFHETGNASSFRPASIQVLDEKGVEYRHCFPSAISGGTFRGKSHEIAFWPIMSYPKDAKRIVLRLTFTDGVTDKTTHSVEFKLPNPPMPKPK